jgi:oligoendopeptidase F
LTLRDGTDEKYKWNLCDIYPDDEAWERDYNRAGELKSRFAAYKGKIGESPDTLLECLRLADEADELLSALTAYSRMRRDEDNSIGKYQGMSDRAADIAAETDAEQAFIEPEIIGIGREKIDGFLKVNPDLGVYAHYFDTLLRVKKHTKSREEEKLLAMSAPLAEAPGEIFSMFNNADIRFGGITDENNEKKELTLGNYGMFLESRSIEVRKAAFETVHGRYKEYVNTLAAAFGSNIKSNVFYAKARNYPSSIEMFLFEDDVNVNVYMNLIEEVGKAIPALSRYLETRKKLLGLDELHMYDLYTPLVEDTIGRIPYEDAKNLVLKACEPLGDEYTGALKNALDGRWVDVYESPGKTPGAFSWGSLSAHPFVLLNYHDRIDDLFTLIHEIGHAMHSFNSNNTQPTVYKSYPIFTAEVASAVNENLLLHYLLNITDDDKKRAFLLNYKLDGIRTTVFRQTMFAEFELNIHNKYESGVPITAELLCEEYLKLNQKYYAPAAVPDELISYEWARIPHFYSSFYVYQYATGYSAAEKLAAGVLSGDNNARDRYTGFLKSGGSDYPLKLLAGAGVDLSDGAAFAETMKGFSETLDEFERLAAAI